MWVKRVIDTNKTNDKAEEDKIKNNKPLLSEPYTKDEFSVESQMLHHWGFEGRNDSKKANVCMAGHRVDRDRWNRSSWSLVAGICWSIDICGRNVVKRNLVQVWAGLEGPSAMAVT